MTSAWGDDMAEMMDAPEPPPPPSRLYNVVDLETSDLEKPGAPKPEIIEFGSTLVSLDLSRQAVVMRPRTMLYRPLGKVSPGARAAHHIQPAELADRFPCTSDDRAWFATRPDYKGAKVSVMVAHNVEFERGFISDADTGGLPWLCTMKAAMRVFPDAPSFSNGVLYYWLLDQGVIPDLGAAAQPMHRAGPDSFITGHVLAALLSRATTQEMIAWTSEPKIFPTCPLGEHRGKPWAEVPHGFLTWMTAKAKDLDPDTKWNAQREIDRRAQQPRSLL